MNCLDLVKIKNYCDSNEAGPFVEEYVDVSARFFSHLADDSEQTGKRYANELLAAAKEQVQADILLSMSNGYSAKDIVYQYINTCKFTETYTNWGVALTNYYRSENSEIHIAEIRYKPEVDGDFVIVIDDGITLTEYNASGLAKQEATLSIEYSTKAKQVKIYAKDPTVKLSMMSCQTGGCGSCAAKRGLHLQMQGYNRTNLTTQPTGFMVRAYVACNLDSIVCSVINRHKALFAKAIAYKVGINAYMRLLISPRLNDTTLNIDGEAVKLYLNTLEAKYKELVWGSVPAYGQAATSGIIKIMQDSYRTLNDQCVSCNTANYTATAIL